MARNQPQQLRARRTHRQLLGAARRVFARQGYDGATVDDLCEAAHCSKGAYYFHFASKEEAFLTLLDAWIVQRTEALRNGGEVLLDGGWPPGLVVEFWAQAARTVKAGRKLRAATQHWRRLLQRQLGQSPGRAGSPEVALALSIGWAAQAALGVPGAHEWAAALDELSRRAALRPTG